MAESGKRLLARRLFSEGVPVTMLGEPETNGLLPLGKLPSSSN